MASPFRNPAAVKESLNLPTVVAYSFVGDSSPEYHARVEEIIGRLAGDANIRKRSTRESSRGRYTAYRFEVYHDTFDTIEAIYAEVGALAGTRFLV